MLPAAHGPRFIQLVVVGGAGVAVNMAVLSALVGLGCWSPVLAEIPAMELPNFSKCRFNDLGAFRRVERRIPWRIHLVRYHEAALVALAVSLTIRKILTSAVRLNYLLAKGLAIGAATLWNHAGNDRLRWPDLMASHRSTSYCAEIAARDAVLPETPHSRQPKTKAVDVTE